MAPLIENPESQRYLIMAVDRCSRLAFAQCCNAPATDDVTRFLGEIEQVASKEASNPAKPGEFRSILAI